MTKFLFQFAIRHEKALRTTQFGTRWSRTFAALPTATVKIHLLLSSHDFVSHFVSVR